MTFTKEQLEELKRRFEAFNRWEAEQAFPLASAAELVADIGAILDWMPPEFQNIDPDPEKHGIQQFRKLLEIATSRR